MSAPIPLRQDFDATMLRILAKNSKDGPQARRHLALGLAMTVQRAPRQPRSAALVCRSPGLGDVVQRARPGWASGW